MPTLQIVSDLHREFRKDGYQPIVPTGDILAMLGDSGCCGNDEDFAEYKSFIEQYLTKFQYVIVVPGNHEYYVRSRRDITKYTTNHYNNHIDNKKNGASLQKNDKKDMTVVQKNDMPGIRRKMNKWAAEHKNLIILDNSVFKYHVKSTKGHKSRSIYFIGSTLWTYVPKGMLKKVQAAMNDYQMIYYQGYDKWTSVRMIDQFRCNVRFIKTWITKAKKAGAIPVVLTHHKPFIQKKLNSAIDYCYQSDLSSIIKAPIKLWAYGHTHERFNGVINGVKVVSNPKGYPYEKTKFNKKFIVEL